MKPVTTRPISSAALVLSLAINLALFGAIDTVLAQANSQAHEPAPAASNTLVLLPRVTVHGKRQPTDSSTATNATITDIAITVDSAPTALPAPRNSQL